MDIHNVVEELMAREDAEPYSEFITDAAERAGVSPVDVAVSMLTSVTLVNVSVSKGQESRETMIPGHVMSDTQTGMRGPRPGCSRLMVVGKCPGPTESQTGYLFTGESGRELYSVMSAAGLEKEWDTAYYTNACRFVPPGGKKTMSASWLNACWWFLWAEANIIRPEYILLLGREAIKAFMGKKATVGKNRGVFKPWALVDGNEVQTFATMHPAATMRDVGQQQGLISDLSKLNSVMSGEGSAAGVQLEYVVVDTDKQLRSLARKLMKFHMFAVDCEWEGERPEDPGSCVLTIQLGWEPGHAALIRLHGHPVGEVIQETFEEDGQTVDMLVSSAPSRAGRVGVKLPNEKVEWLDALEPVFKPSVDSAISILRDVLCRPEVMVTGHNLKSDMPWLKSLGLDLTDQFLRCFDTMLAHHLLVETGEQNLTSVQLKYTDMGRTDTALTRWLDVYKDRFSDRPTSGFGHVPEGLLYPYALADADASYRIAQLLKSKLTGPDRDMSCGDPEDMWRLLCDVIMPATAAVMEMEQTGLLIDRERLEHLTRTYHAALELMESRFREQINWPDFNFRSVFQVRELLFGYELNGQRDNDGKPRKLAPDGAYCCYLTPIKTTDKPPMPWDRVEREGLTLEASPSTDAESLQILGPDNDVARDLQDMKFVDQMCKNFLVDPEQEGKADKGLQGAIKEDGRIHTTIIQTKETGRWASRSPNCQNIPKLQEFFLEEVFNRVYADGEVPYRPPLRSVVMAPPGHVLLAADFEQAEMFVLAYLSGDSNFKGVLTENPVVPVLVSKDDPEEVLLWMHPGHSLDSRIAMTGRADRVLTSGSSVQLGDKSWNIPKDAVVGERRWHRDLHSETAIKMFKLDYCPEVHGPPKAWIEGNDLKKWRHSAKTINFGGNLIS